jgi:hypothetical protein
MSNHRFVYADQSPTTARDPSGYFTLAEAASTVAILGIVTPAVVSSVNFFGAVRREGILNPDGFILSIAAAAGGYGVTAGGDFDLVLHLESGAYSVYFSPQANTEVSLSTLMAVNLSASVSIGLVYELASSSQMVGSGYSVSFPSSWTALVPGRLGRVLHQAREIAGPLARKSSLVLGYSSGASYFQFSYGASAPKVGLAGTYAWAFELVQGQIPQQLETMLQRASAMRDTLRVGNAAAKRGALAAIP